MTSILGKMFGISLNNNNVNTQPHVDTPVPELAILQNKTKGMYSLLTEKYGEIERWQFVSQWGRF